MITPTRRDLLFSRDLFVVVINHCFTKLTVCTHGCFDKLSCRDALIYSTLTIKMTENNEKWSPQFPRTDFKIVLSD